MILWMDDPSYYTTAELAVRYTALGISPLVTAAVGRFGGFAWWTQANGGNSSFIRTPAFGNTTTGVIAFSIKVLGALSVSESICTFFDGGINQCDLRLNPGSQLFVTRNGTPIGPVSTNSLALNAWYRIEFQLTVNSSSGHIEVRVNGTSTNWIPPTGGLNTQNTANNSFSEASIGLSGGFLSPNVYLNDFIVTNNNTPNANFLGDARSFLRMPNANSAVMWTPVGAPTNWQAISEIPADGDTSYNTSSTPGDEDLFTIPSLPVGAQNIVAVNNVLYCRKDDAGVRTVHGLIKSGATVATGPDFPLSTTYLFADFIQETDPATGAPWVAAGVNAALVGYEEVA